MTRSRLALASALVFGFAFAAHAAPETPNGSIRIEVPVQAALAPLRGFDDNDDVQVVVHGMLPNACYTLADHDVIEGSAPGTKRIRQFATRNATGICAQDSALPEHLAMAVPFTTEISLGQLPAGDYQFEFKPASAGSPRIRPLNVAPATAITIDSLPYAAVTQAMASDIIGANEKIEVTLRGLLNSSCTELDPDIKVVRQNDVTIVMPTIKHKRGVLCMQVLIPFEHTLTLDRANVGHHLIHVRSMSGKAVNRIVEVVPLP